eukprot:NODE_5234_length_681_cov_67.593863_g5071_i0.p1 GENE.NODE_5234_length_681_cov_67.593863_g5071_i0~~NODE_5234_length_681_cov_67.593863_g5071_i0.p1  ORF type:complete len:179 (+),score=62.78 NODE_5234_length_681_cov_67.593863_g5071_i0:52-537(+)
MGIAEKAAEINATLTKSGKPFLSGNKPGEADLKAFQDMIGKDNTHLWRWVKLIASYTQEERAAWETAAKAGIVAKSSIILDIKPWDDETDLAAMEQAIRSIEMPGLHWGASKLVEVAFGIKKLQILLNIVDDLVSSDDLEDRIMAQEDFVQSMDVVAWNKL